MAQRLSQLASELWPFLLPKVGAMVQGAGGGAGVSGGGTIGLHDLSGSLHKGTLADAQAPQFLLRSGARSLTGDLAVDAGVTIDGVDISAHAVDPNAHHAKLHAITDAANHSVTGSQYQIVGLTAVNTLGLLTPSSSPAANAIVKTDGASMVTFVDITVTSDLFLTGYLDFGTDTMYEDASYLQVTGSKAVRFGQNIGNANWTVYNAGGASFGGNVDIVGSGDLYVAGSLGGAGGVLKTSGNRVGIACVPDSQFALDVAGPARAQYFIGPHAIQLKDATMILHFDGATPYATNYNGILLGHKGQAATVSGGYVFRPGKFQKALQIAAATTNLVQYPSLENGTLGSVPDGWNMNGAGTFVKSADVAHYGSYSGKLTVSNQQGFPTHSLASTINLANAYTVSAWVWIESYTAGTLQLSVQRTDTFAEVMAANADTTKLKQWQRVVATYAGGGSGSVSARVKVQTSTGATMTVYFDGVQVEQSAYATPYCDGSLNPIGSTAHAWTGTAHASTSARTATALYYSIGNINPREGTISAWVWVDGFFNYNRLFHGYNGNGNFDYYLSSAGAANFRYNSVNVSAGTLTARSWQHIAVTWSLETGKATAYLNGIQIAQSNITGPVTLDSTSLSLGSWWGSEQINGLIDDFAILSTAIDANQVRAIYESNAPVFAESSTVSWVATPSGLVWADERGLWMRDTSGNPVLGVYGGEAATYSWGGFTMASGDLVLGRNAVGSSAILWDQSAGTFGFYGAGNATAQASVATDGSIQAGAGAVALNSSGIQITAPSSQSAIGSYKFYVTGKTITSGLSAYYNSGADTYYTGVWSNSSNIGNITTGIDATIGGGGTVKILFGLTNSLGTTSTVYTLSGGNVATLWIGSGGTNYVGIGTAAAPTRAFQVNGGVFAGGDDTGLAGYTQITNSTQGVGSGTGTIKVNGTTARNSTGWLKIYVGTSIKYVPYFDTVTG